MNRTCDFSGYATRANLRCSDGRVIMPGAFKDADGQEVPLVWNHIHNDPFNVLGKAILEHREDGVYAYCTFNETEQGKNAKMLVEHGDVVALSICANKLKQDGSKVMHGKIRELSLVLAGANPGAFIDSVSLSHGEESSDEAIIYTGENIMLYHSDEEKDPKQQTPPADEGKKGDDKEETVEDVVNSMNEKQKTVMYALIGQALEDAKGDDKSDEEDDDKEEKSMKHNVFDSTDMTNDQNVLTHADGEAIVKLAKSSNVGTLQTAIGLYADEHFDGGEDSLQHAFEDMEVLFPEYKDVRPGMPETLKRDQGWISSVIAKTHKSPISRIRTRQFDARHLTNNVYGYTKGTQKKKGADLRAIKRTTDPQTIYTRDVLNRDDIIDITDFDVVQYQYGIMRELLNEELALAIMISDGRDDDDPDKISEDHIRSIWHDKELYTIHFPVTIDGVYSQEIQRAINLTGNSVNYTENYKYAEALIAAALISREKYKGTGKPDFYCEPHLLNIMLLARDLNGRRLYDDVADLAKALNVGEIHTAEQFAGKKRYGSATTNDADKCYDLIGLFVNLADYTLGATKGGEITKFQQFDIDFNQEKLLLETRLSGALTRIQSAIALEMVTTIEDDEEEETTPDPNADPVEPQG